MPSNMTPQAMHRRRVGVAYAKEDGALQMRHPFEMRTREIEEAASKAAPSFQLLIDCNDRQTFMRIRGISNV